MPAGRARLATKPEPIGSETLTKTIGTALLSRCNATTTGVVWPKMASGLSATISFASA